MSARPLQVEGDRLLSGVQGPALLLVEAPMGEGKTELAFLAHLRLQAANQHRGLYVALPTQATGNALFERALTFLRAFSEDCSPGYSTGSWWRSTGRQRAASASAFMVSGVITSVPRHGFQSADVGCCLLTA